MSDDYYAILGVSESATAAEIKQAYRNLARKYHPDRNPGDTEATDRFKDAAEAYRVLGDAELRAQYDQFRSSGGGPKIPAAATEAAGDVLDELFGTARRKKKERSNEPPSRARRATEAVERGDDLRYDLEIDFEEAARGTEHIVYVPSATTCRACAGTGAEPGSAPIICSRCSGRGTVREQQGFFDTTRRCPDCGGAGKMSPNPCRQCEGSGTIEGERPVEVDVPPGIDTGTRLRVRGAGRPGTAGGPAGDLIVVVTVREHPFFRREGNDLFVEVPITMTQAALGDHVEIPTLDGPMRMRIPPGSQTGRVFRLQEQGLVGRDGRRGDQRVAIKVRTPTDLTTPMRELLERFADLEDELEEDAEIVDFRHEMARYYRRRR